MTASPVLARALIRPRISPALREQVMLAVTSVNDCRYCNWGHTALALRHGVDLAALRQTLGSGSLGADSTPDQVAVLYAQHVASEQGDADPGAERALAAAWTPAERAEIKAHIAAITFGNLVGNSADAWLARLRGVAVEGGHPAREAIAALAGLPALLSVWAWTRRPGSGGWTRYEIVPAASPRPRLPNGTRTRCGTFAPGTLPAPRASCLMQGPGGRPRVAPSPAPG